MRMGVGVNAPGKLTVGTLDLGDVCTGRQSEDTPRARGGDGSGAGGSSLPCPTTTVQELARLEGCVVNRPAGGPDGDAEREARVLDQLESGESREHLATQGSPHDGRREAELVDEHLAVQSPRGQRAEERSTQDVVARRSVAAKDLGEGRTRAVEIHGDHETARQKDAMAAPAIFGEL
jgi:hypothetical protein